MSLASIILIGKLLDCSRIKTIVVGVERGFWQNEMISVLLPCVELSMVVVCWN